MSPQKPKTPEELAEKILDMVSGKDKNGERWGHDTNCGSECDADAAALIRKRDEERDDEREVKCPRCKEVFVLFSKAHIDKITKRIKKSEKQARAAIKTKEGEKK